MDQRNPLTATELKLLDRGRSLVRARVQELGGFDRAATEWGLNRKTLSAYVDGGRQQNRRSATRILEVIHDIETELATVGNSVSRATDTADAKGEGNPLRSPRLHSNRHFMALHERATAEQRKFLLQLMLDSIEANVRDMREILDIESTPGESLPEIIAAIGKEAAARGAVTETVKGKDTGKSAPAKRRVGGR